MKVERDVALNVNMIGPEFRDDVRIAIVRKCAPPNLNSHLQLTAEEYEGSYPRFRTKAEVYFASREQEEKLEEQLSTSALSTDLSYLCKGRGKSACQKKKRKGCARSETSADTAIWYRIRRVQGRVRRPQQAASEAMCVVIGVTERQSVRGDFEEKKWPRWK